MRLQTSMGSQSWEWEAFSSYRESLYFFHLYFDKRSFFLIPKDAFASVMEEDDARTLIKQSILPKKK
jgi:hypothetical protein